MNNLIQEAPERVIARMAGEAERLLTPCGEGHMVSHVWGSGPPIVLLHGNAGSWTHWIRNIDALSRHYRVIAVDIPGFGDSAMPPAPYSHRSIAEIIAGGAAQIAGEGKIGVAGFSFGASIASETAHALGARLGGLVLISARNTMADLTLHSSPKFLQWRTLETAQERDMAHRRNLAAMMISTEERIDELSVVIQKTNAERSRLRSEAMGPSTATQSRVPVLPVPVSFIWAERDIIIGPYMHERIAWIRRYRPDARYSIIPDAGHWMIYEQAERSNEVLLDLLKQD